MNNVDTKSFLARAWNQAVQKPKGKEFRLVDNWIKLLLADPKKRLLNDVIELRLEFNIPELVECEDIFDPQEKDRRSKKKNSEIKGYYLDPESLPTQSIWILSECNKKKLLFEKIDKLVERYCLPSYFSEWMERFILYDEIGKTPFYDHNLEIDFFQNPEKYKTIGLTPREKQKILHYYGQQPKKGDFSEEEIDTLTTQLKKYLKKIKDKPRAIDISDEDITILTLDGFSTTVVNEIYDEFMSPELEQVRAGTIRKRKNRLLILLEKRIKPR